MKNFYFILFLFLSCNNKFITDECNNAIANAKSEIEKKNIYYNFNVDDEITNYYIFKKYGLINYLELFDKSKDSCFKKIMLQEIKSRGINIYTLKNEIDSMNDKISSTIYNTIKSFNYKSQNDYPLFKFTDGIPEFDADGYMRPRIVYPEDSDKFLYKIQSEVSTLDPTFDSSSFWIKLDKYGVVKSIEFYKKNSPSLDNYIKKAFSKTKWQPLQSKISKKKYDCRFLFHLYAK